MIKYKNLLRKSISILKNDGMYIFLLKSVCYIKRIIRAVPYSRRCSQIIKSAFTQNELAQQREYVFSKNIMFSIVVPLYNTPESFLHQMIQSVSDQTYSNWELCMADGSDKEHHNIEVTCRAYAKKDERIKYKKLQQNGGISENSNACLEMASGDYIALLDHDDLLHPAALHEVMKVICEKDADFIYTDEAIFKKHTGRIVKAHFKPDFAIDNLRANNYICHFTVFSRRLMENAGGGFRKDFDGSQDHDLVLRLTKKAKKIIHIPIVLYYWRCHSNSAAQDISTKIYAVNAGKSAVKDSIRQLGYEAEVESYSSYSPCIYRLNYKLKSMPKISIIILNKSHSNIETCVNSILSLTTYPNYEIVIVDNGANKPKINNYYESLKKNPCFIIRALNTDFNFAKLGNFAAQLASGEFFIFLDNDIKVVAPNWIEEMLMYGQRDDVAVVGAILYGPNNTVQHAGIILGLGADHIAGNAFAGVKTWEDAACFGRLYYAQNMSAVSAACMTVKASVYRELGGFDESFAVSYSDVDFCMRVKKAGYLIVWTPHAKLYRNKCKNRGYEDIRRKNKDIKLFRERWAKELQDGDPYYNPNLTLDRHDFSLRRQNENKDWNDEFF